MKSNNGKMTGSAMQGKDPSDYNVRAVERAMQILTCFDDEHPERGVSEIGQIVRLHKATAHRIVTTLVNYGFLERAADGQRYRLGMRLADLGYKVVGRLNLRREALPFMTLLTHKWGETCDLSLYEDGQVLYIEVLPGSFALSIKAAVGLRLPAYCTASGKLFLANLPATQLEDFLKHPLIPQTKKTITSPDELRRQLAKILEQGYGLDDEEMEVGIRAIAAPVRDLQGVMIAAISIPSPTSRMTMERVPEMLQSLKETADEVSRRMGWNG
jgi:IclR family KDG regulon transcriptional repressor